MTISNQSNLAYDTVFPDNTTEAATLASNVVTTEVLDDLIAKVKSSDKTFLREGEQAEQTVVITNNSTAPITGINFRDTMSEGAAYVAGSVTVDGTSQPTYDPATGFALADLAAGQSTTVKYTVEANAPLTGGLLTNYATVTFTVDDPERGPVTLTQNTNTVEISLVSDSITNVKSVDKGVAERGDTLRYTSVISNTGTTEKTNLVFTDAIPAGTTFVAGSVTINGTSYSTNDPAAGFPLPDLAAGQSLTVEFDVRVN